MPYPVVKLTIEYPLNGTLPDSWPPLFSKHPKIDIQTLPVHWGSSIPGPEPAWACLVLEYLFNILCISATGYPTLQCTWNALCEGQEDFDKHKNTMLYRYTATSILVRLPPGSDILG